MRFAWILAFLCGLQWPAYANEDAVRAVVERAFPTKRIDSVRLVPELGLYEVYVNSSVFFVDKDARFIVTGAVFDGRTLRNISQDSQDRLSRVDFRSLPLNQAIKTVVGNGSRVIATFEDPNCGYCKAYAGELAQLKDVTIYTFLYPVLSADSVEKARAVWCSARPAAAWSEWMKQGTPPVANRTCQTPLEANLELGRRLNVGVTPTTFLASGRRLVGVAPLATLEAELQAAARK